MKERKREAAALAMLSCKTIREAAQATGLSETTIYRWKKEPGFQAILESVKADALNTASNNLAALSTDAVSVLKEISSDKNTPPAQRVSAARSLLETAFKLREQDEIIRRLENIEQAQAEKNEGWC